MIDRIFPSIDATKLSSLDTLYVTLLLSISDPLNAIEIVPSSSNSTASKTVNTGASFTADTSTLNCPVTVAVPSDAKTLIIDEPKAFSIGFNVIVLPFTLVVSNNSLFSASTVNDTASPSTSVALKLTTIFSPSSATASGFSIEERTGTSFTLSIVTLKEIDAEFKFPSLAVTVILPVPTLSSSGLTVRVAPETLIVNKSLEDSALNEKFISPSISDAFNMTVVSVSSRVVTFEMVTMAGASFTGFTVISKLSDVSYSPPDSATVTVITDDPLKFEVEEKFNDDPSKLTLTLFSDDVTVTERVSPS